MTEYRTPDETRRPIYSPTHMASQQLGHIWDLHTPVVVHNTLC